MRLLLLLAILAAPGCAGTTLYRGGQRILHTQADIAEVTYRDGSTYFHAKGLNHSRPTDAGGRATAKVIQGTTGLATAIGASLATKGVIKP